MNMSFGNMSFGNKSASKGLLLMSDDEDESGDEDYYAKANRSSRGRRRSSDDASVGSDGEKSTKSFFSNVVRKSLRRKSRSEASQNTLPSELPLSPETSPKPAVQRSNSSTEFLSAAETGAAQLVFLPQETKTPFGPAVTSPPSEERPAPKSRQTPTRAHTTGTMNMMFMSDMAGGSDLLQMQCAASMAAPSAAPSKRKKNRDAIEAYNAKIAAKKAAKAAAAGEGNTTSTSQGKQKMKIRVKVPKGSDPALVAAMAQQASADHKVPVRARIKRSDAVRHHDEAPKTPTSRSRTSVGHSSGSEDENATKPVATPNRQRALRTHSRRVLSSTDGSIKVAAAAAAVNVDAPKTPHRTKSAPIRVNNRRKLEDKVDSSPRSPRRTLSARKFPTTKSATEVEISAPLSPRTPNSRIRPKLNGTDDASRSPSVSTSPKTPSNRSRRRFGGTGDDSSVSPSVSPSKSPSTSPKSRIRSRPNTSLKRLDAGRGDREAKSKLASASVTSMSVSTMPATRNAVRTFSNRPMATDDGAIGTNRPSPQKTASRRVVTGRMTSSPTSRRISSPRKRPQKTEGGMSSVQARIRQFNS